MGAIADISLKNFAGTEEVFTANQPVNGVTWYFLRNSGSPLGHPAVSTQLILPSYLTGRQDTGRTAKVRLNLYAPVLETAGMTAGGYTADPKQAYRDVCRIEFALAERGAQANRKDLMARAVDLFSEANVQDMIWNLNGTY